MNKNCHRNTNIIIIRIISIIIIKINKIKMINIHVPAPPIRSYRVLKDSYFSLQAGDYVKVKDCMINLFRF